MPSTSEKQRRLMEAAAADPEVAKRTGVPQSVAREFRKEDRAKLRKKKPTAKASARMAMKQRKK